MFNKYNSNGLLTADEDELIHRYTKSVLGVDVNGVETEESIQEYINQTEIIGGFLYAANAGGKDFLMLGKYKGKVQSWTQQSLQ